MLHFYVLCCRNLTAVKRHATIIPKTDFSIVINTLDTDFKAEAENYCQAENINYYITESDGTPATGKNSVIDLFLASSYDHFVLIDGDDFLTPHGVWTYKYISNLDSPPDVLALEYQFGLWRQTGYGGLQYYVEDKNLLNNPYLGCNDKTNPEKIQGFGARVFLQDYNWWNKATSGKLIKTFNTQFSKDLSSVHQRWTTHCYNYISKWETHLRVVFFSRLAAQTHRYDSDFKVGEDTLIYLKYKNSYINNELTLKHLFDRYPTYVYDTRIAGIVEQEKFDTDFEDKGWYNWLKKLTEEYDRFEDQNLMHNIEVPKINDEINWPDNYIPDVMKLVNFPGKNKIIF